MYYLGGVRPRRRGAAAGALNVMINVSIMFIRNIICMFIILSLV